MSTETPFDLYGEPAKPSPAKSKKAGNNGVEADQLLSFVERAERLTAEKQAIADDIKEVKAEAKAAGYDMTAFNEMLKLRAMDKAEREEREALRTLYSHALNLFD